VSGGGGVLIYEEWKVVKSEREKSEDLLVNSAQFNVLNLSIFVSFSLTQLLQVNKNIYVLEREKVQ
jgi:hypothetical protein